MARRRCTVGLSVRTSLDPRMQKDADQALRDGLIAYDKVHGGWRGAVAHIDLTGDWAAHLAQVPVPGVVNDVGWQLAVVLRSAAGGTEIGFTSGETGHIPFAEMRWARRRYHNASLGPLPRGPGDVVKPGDVVMVTPIVAAQSTKVRAGKDLAGKDLVEANVRVEASGRVEAKGRAGGEAAPDGFSLCQVPEVSGALMRRRTRIPVGCLRSAAGSALPSASSIGHTGLSADRFCDQAVRVSDRARPWLHTLDAGQRRADLVAAGAGAADVVAEQLRSRQVPRADAVAHRARTVDRTLTVRLATMVGMKSIADTIERFGIIDHVPQEYAITLGAGSTTPLRLTAAYAMRSTAASGLPQP